jgi:hypothetical protein
MSRNYSSEQIQRIIRRAQKSQMSDEIDHEELLRMASELGLDLRAVEAAAAAEDDAANLEAERTRKRRRRREQFRQHFSVFLIVMVFIFILNLLTRGPFWFQWPLLGWGLGVAFHYHSAYFPSEEDLDREA